MSGTRLVVYCQPGAPQTRVVGWHGDKPKIQLKAPPVDGEANKALIAFVAQRCGLPKTAVTLELGASSRTKRVHVAGINPADLHTALGLEPPPGVNPP
ncbi:MAG: hypothetical protein RJA09_282 [Pseudomonadota bacterium]|jgi:uncharacterized protein (TIGR00251 family)